MQFLLQRVISFRINRGFPILSIDYLMCPIYTESNVKDMNILQRNIQASLIPYETLGGQ